MMVPILPLKLEDQDFPDNMQFKSQDNSHEAFCDEDFSDFIRTIQKASPKKELRKVTSWLNDNDKDVTVYAPVELELPPKLACTYLEPFGVDEINNFRDGKDVVVLLRDSDDEKDFSEFHCMRVHKPKNPVIHSLHNVLGKSFINYFPPTETPSASRDSGSSASDSGAGSSSFSELETPPASHAVPRDLPDLPKRARCSLPTESPSHAGPKVSPFFPWPATRTSSVRDSGTYAELWARQSEPARPATPTSSPQLREDRPKCPLPARISVRDSGDFTEPWGTFISLDRNKRHSDAKPLPAGKEFCHPNTGGKPTPPKPAPSNPSKPVFGLRPVKLDHRPRWPVG